MASSLLNILEQHRNSTPDEIARILTDPVPQWRRTNTLTLPEFNEHARVRIVICNEQYRNNPDDDVVEMHHYVGWGGHDRDFHRWDWDDWEEGVLHGSRWWFRSLASFERSVGEGF